VRTTGETAASTLTREWSPELESENAARSYPCSMRAKHVAFAAVPSLLAVAVIGAAWVMLEPHKSAEQKGKELNERAWQATFSERRLPIPESGPREGYWGSLTEPYLRTTSDSSWRLADVHVPGRIEVDAEGMQHFRPTADEQRRILIIGGSVAWGAYASSIDATYFSVLGRTLERLGAPATIDVLAAPAWKSTHELDALSLSEAASRIDLVIVLDGLNDLIPLKPGDSHDGNFGPSLIRYLDNIDRMARLCSDRRCKLLVVLQPSLSERARPTALEQECQKASREDVTPRPGQLSFGQALAMSFDFLRKALGDRQTLGNLYFFDATRLFDREKATTFCDAWHFADPGHAIVGEALAAEVERVLASENH